jgi:exonuclease SbcC
MILKKLILKNIRSHKQGTITFPEGSTLLMGDIGSGKTSILLAIEFALFGLQPSQRGTSILRSKEDEGSVRLEFELDEHEVAIERKLKRGSKTIAQTNACIIIDGQRHEGSVTEIKNKILELLNYPPEFKKKTNDLYKFTVYTPQEEMKQIILEPAETRLNTLRHVFGIDKYKRIGENLDKLGVKLRQEIRVQEAQLGNIDEIKTGIETKKVLLTEKQTKIKDLESQIKQIQDKKQSKQSEIKSLEEKINEKKTLENEKDKAQLMLSNKKEQMQNFDREILSLQTQIKEGKKFEFKPEEFEHLKSRIESQEQILKQVKEEQLQLITRIQSRETQKSEADNLKNKIMGLQKCPTCLQEVNQQYKQNIITNANSVINRVIEQNQGDEQKKQELEKKIDQLTKQIQAYKNSLSEMDILKVKLENLKEKEIKVTEIQTQKQNIENDIDMIQSQITNFNKLIEDLQKYAPEYEQKNKELQEITQQETNLNINKAEINKEIQFLNQQIQESQDKIKKLEELAEKINNLKELESWLTTKLSQLVSYTEKNVMLKLREEFSDLFSKWFSILVAEELSVRLDETFTPVVQQLDYEIDYNFLSGGERTAVALAYRLALNQVINSLLSKIKTHDLVILDEPTDGFSDSQLDKMRDVLDQLKIKQLILVSHEQKIEGFVDNIIRLKKQEGTSEVTE